ncbi:hypothetical protein B0H13DRAFT_2668745 [Mycena leptocephala]|nr:hypothetical protein B0H13DRAFT_2668745 [Mycena leptocephala]
MGQKPVAILIASGETTISGNACDRNFFGGYPLSSSSSPNYTHCRHNPPPPTVTNILSLQTFATFCTTRALQLVVFRLLLQGQSSHLLDANSTSALPCPRPPPPPSVLASPQRSVRHAPRLSAALAALLDRPQHQSTAQEMPRGARPHTALNMLRDCDAGIPRRPRPPRPPWPSPAQSLPAARSPRPRAAPTPALRRRQRRLDRLLARHEDLRPNMTPTFTGVRSICSPAFPIAHVVFVASAHRDRFELDASPLTLSGLPSTQERPHPPESQLVCRTTTTCSTTAIHSPCHRPRPSTVPSSSPPFTAIIPDPTSQRPRLLCTGTSARTAARMRSAGGGRLSSPVLRSSGARTPRHIQPGPTLNSQSTHLAVSPVRRAPSRPQAGLLHLLPIAGVALVAFSPVAPVPPSLDDRPSSAGCVSPRSPRCSTPPPRIATRLMHARARTLSSQRLRPFFTEARRP